VAVVVPAVTATARQQRRRVAPAAVEAQQLAAVVLRVPLVRLQPQARQARRLTVCVVVRVAVVVVQPLQRQQTAQRVAQVAQVAAAGAVVEPAPIPA
jgi:hypothetical protein